MKIHGKRETKGYMLILDNLHIPGRTKSSGHRRKDNKGRDKKLEEEDRKKDSKFIHKFV